MLNRMDLRDAYVGPGGVLSGSARLAQEAQEKAAQTLRSQMVERRRLEMDRKRKTLEAQIAAMRAEFEAQEFEELNVIAQEQALETTLRQNRVEMGLSRRADTPLKQPKVISK